VPGSPWPVDIFASSGGVVNALALVARHPEQVRTLVAHEPPASQELPDREPVLAACVDIHQTYLDDQDGMCVIRAAVSALATDPNPPDAQ
jgi:pimeloyl-ACP methyl ester carboxylesterase